MKKILFIHHVSQIGGASYCLLNIIKSLDRCLYQPVVLLKEEGPLIKELQKLDVEVLYLPSMATTPYNLPIYRFSSLRNYLRMYKALKYFRNFLQMRSDLNAVYCNNLMLSDYVRVAKEEGLKVFIHIREHWPLDEHIFQLKHIQNNLKLADQVIAINRYSASIAKNTNVEIVYDWIDLDNRYAPVNMNDFFGEDVSSKKIMIYTGGLNSIKGAYYVVKGFTECVNGDEYRLLMLGDYRAKENNRIKGFLKFILKNIGYTSYSQKVISSLCADKRIKTIPSTYYLKDIVQKAYCNLSYFTIPHANLTQAECLLVGTPTICAKTDESLEYSLEGGLSYLFDLGNYESFCEVLRTFEKDYINKKRKILDKRSDISQMFSREVNVDRLTQIIKSVLFEDELV